MVNKPLDADGIRRSIVEFRNAFGLNSDQVWANGNTAMVMYGLHPFVKQLTVGVRAAAMVQIAAVTGYKIERTDDETPVMRCPSYGIVVFCSGDVLRKNLQMVHSVLCYSPRLLLKQKLSTQSFNHVNDVPSLKALIKQTRGDANGNG